MVSFTPRLLYPLGKRPIYPASRKLDGPQLRSGRLGEEKKKSFLQLPEVESQLLDPLGLSQSAYTLSCSLWTSFRLTNTNFIFVHLISAVRETCRNEQNYNSDV